MPTTRSLGRKSIDDEVRDPAFHVDLEQQGHPRGVRQVWVGSDDHATTDGLGSGKKERNSRLLVV